MAKNNYEAIQQAIEALSVAVEAGTPTGEATSYLQRALVCTRAAWRLEILDAAKIVVNPTPALTAGSK